MRCWPTRPPRRSGFWTISPPVGVNISDLNANLLTHLVPGGAGFIGSHLIDALLADATTKEVRVLDNFSSGRREHLRSERKLINPPCPWRCRIHRFTLD